MPTRTPYRRPEADAPRFARPRDSEARAADKAFYASARWRKVRATVLADEPLCRDCNAAGVYRLAQMVDHVAPRKLRPELAFERSNLRPLCNPCHNRRHPEKGQGGARG